jgi:hypothetical protein
VEASIKGRVPLGKIPQLSQASLLVKLNTRSIPSQMSSQKRAAAKHTEDQSGIHGLAYWTRSRGLR